MTTCIETTKMRPSSYEQVVEDEQGAFDEENKVMVHMPTQSRQAHAHGRNAADETSSDEN